MKKYLADTEKENAQNHCNGCQTGWGSAGMGADEHGEYFETHGCEETCEKLKKRNAAEHFKHIEIKSPLYLSDPIDGAYRIMRELSVRLTEAIDDEVVNAVVAEARREGITDIYLLEKPFVMAALREKAERENPQSLTLDELKQMDGEAVYHTRLGMVVIGFRKVGGAEHGGYDKRYAVGFSYGWEWLDDVARSGEFYRYKPKEGKRERTD